jgi:uncharacterized coiled-coil protein SlyX
MGLFLLPLVCSGLLGCATPAVVRSLSQEQLKAQEAFANSLSAYFGVIERFAEAQRLEAARRIDELTLEIRNLNRRRALGRLEGATDAGGRQAVLDEFAQQVQADVATSEAQKAQVAALTQKLKEKNQALLAAYAAILDAQRKLNEYVQLQKWDEAIVNQLLASVGLNRERVSQLASEVGTAAGDILKLVGDIRKVAGQPPTR